MRSRVLESSIVNKKTALGQVQFSKSSFTDPHIVKIIDAIVAAGDAGIDKAFIVNTITQKQQQMSKFAAMSPALYKTMSENMVETELFNILWKQSTLKTSAPQFSKKTFKFLVRAIMAENDELWPLQGFIDKRRLNPNWLFVPQSVQTGLHPSHKTPAQPGDESTPSHYRNVDTAAASPSGDFIFSVHFCQKLLDYAHLKELKPMGKKYVSNGGDIPDEYAYIEFLIMHEAFHYAHEDFYYQDIIPDAKNKIINWVGDFRSNYLLVKSGYAQLPMGLYSDEINYDRQKTYRQMYDKVHEEMKKMQDSAPSAKVGDIVQNADTGEYGEVVAVDIDGPQVKPITVAEIKAKYPKAEVK